MRIPVLFLSVLTIGLYACGGTSSGGKCAPITDTVATVCSKTGPARDATFKNNCDVPVEIWWVNGTCGENFYKQLAPGASYTQASFETHPWRARLVSDAGTGTGKGALIKEFGPIPSGTGAQSFEVP